MDFQQIVLYALGFVITVFGLYLIYVGSLGLVKKRPLLFPSRHFMVFMFFIYLLGLIISFQPLFESRRFRDPFLSIAPFVSLVLIILMAFMLRQQMAGYTILGVYDDTFREALTFALKKLNLPFQESISKIKLVELNADLQATVSSWMGTAQIRIKQSQHSRHIKNIAAVMDEYYKDNSVKVNYLAFASYLILGICVIILVAVTTFF